MYKRHSPRASRSQLRLLHGQDWLDLGMPFPPQPEQEAAKRGWLNLHKLDGVAVYAVGERRAAFEFRLARQGGDLRREGVERNRRNVNRARPQARAMALPSNFYRMTVMPSVGDAAPHQAVAQRGGTQPLQGCNGSTIFSLPMQCLDTVEGSPKLEHDAIVIDVKIGQPLEECGVVALQSVNDLAQTQLVVCRAAWGAVGLAMRLVRCRV
mmetsp:Transcript_14249/g.28750  ORF Transcript_14249/g.28750 Transcript_14249/m.28750 type:complete len:210 (-) Transcript_14249:561-1190(-)